MTRATDAVLKFALVGVMGLAYVPVLVELWNDWLRDSNYHHGVLIPLVSLYVLWQKRAALKATTVSPCGSGFIGVLAALTLLILGTAAAEVFTQRISLLVLCASLVWFLAGWRHLKLVFFPIAFLALAIPLPYIVYYGLTLPMQALAAKAGVVGLKLVGVPSVVQGNIIYLAGGGRLEVAEACSGIRSLYAFLAAGALMAYSVHIAWWGRLLVFATAIPLTIAGNAFRVWGSGVGAWVFGQQATHGTPHELFGLFVFVFTLGIFYLLKKAAQSIWSPDTSRSLSSLQQPGSMPASSGEVPRP